MFFLYPSQSKLTETIILKSKVDKNRHFKMEFPFFFGRTQNFRIKTNFLDKN